MADITSDSTLIGSGRSFDHRLEGLVARLSRARRRVLLGLYFQGLAISVLVGLAAFCALQILGGLFGENWLGLADYNKTLSHLAIALGVGVVALVVSIVVANRRKPWLTSLARTADQRFRLEETMSTALEFGVARSHSVITEALIQRAQRRTPEVDAGQLAPFFLPRWMMLAGAGLLALSVGLAFVQPPAVLENIFDGRGSGGGDATPVTEIERVQTAANLHAIAAIIRQDGEQRADPTLQTLAAQMEDLANRLENGTAMNHNDVYDELARLNNLTAAAYQRAGERAGGAGDQSRLVQAALENFDPTRVAAEAEAARQATLQERAQANPEAADVDVPFEARVLRGGETDGAGETGVAPGMGVRAQDINQTPGVPGNQADLLGDTAGITPEDIYGPDGPDGPGGPVPAPAGGEMVGLAGGAEAGDVAGLGAAELFGNGNPIAAITAAGEMMLEDRNPAGGRHIILDLPPLAQLLGVDGAPPGAGGWENRAEQQVTRTPVPVTDREVIQRYFDALMAGGRTE